jgi:ankyrin repeat protein
MTTNNAESAPNLDYYRKQAKALLKAARAGNADAIARVQTHVLRLKHASAAGQPLDLALHEVQLTIARENGFPSWPKFQAHVAGQSLDVQLTRFRPHVRGTDWYEERVAGILSTQQSGLPESFEEIRRYHPRFENASDDQIRSADFTSDDARVILAREHGFKSWAEFMDYIKDIESGKRREPFTEAFDAITGNNMAAFSALLQGHPDLVEAQGTNGSTLLHLAVSLNRPKMAMLLLDKGADVNAPTTRGLTPLHQAAMSGDSALIKTLITAGASLTANAYGDGGTPLVMALFWGRDQSRQNLSGHGIYPENLRAAAGTGDLDLLARCFRGDELTDEAKARRGFYRPHTGFPIWKPSDDRQQVIDEAFTYAARNEQMEAMAFLLQKGADINGDPYRGTALVWAVFTGRADVVEWLLHHGANVNQRSTFGGPQHGQGFTALHAAVDQQNLPMVGLLIKNGADLTMKDEIYTGTPLDWAEHFDYNQIADEIKRHM